MSYTDYDFPHTHMYDSDLREILAQIFKMEVELNTFISVNSIKYADPIQWDITTQYEANTIVIDPSTGTAYLSTQPVPSGVALSNEDYWTVVFDLSAFITKSAGNFTNRIENETTTATIASNVGDWIMLDEVLYHAISNINIGDSYVVDGNIEHITMEDLYNLILGIISSETQARIDEDDIISGNVTTLTNRVVSIDPYEKFRNKTIEVIGDSISSYSTLQNNWVKFLTDFMAAYDCTVINRAVDGDSFAGLAQKITDGTYTVDAADYYIVFLGTNYADSWGYTTGSNPLTPAIATVCNAIRAAANTDAKFFYVSPLKKFMSNVNTLLNPISVMRNVLELLMTYQGYTVISGYNIGELSAATTSRYLTDLLHPTEAFSPILFKYILDGLISERSNITQPASESRTFRNTLSSSSAVTIKYDGLHIIVKIDVNSFAPSTGAWIDICDLPTLLDDQPFPYMQLGPMSGETYQYRISSNKLQAYFFTAPSTTFKDMVDFYITAQQMC